VCATQLATAGELNGAGALGAMSAACIFVYLRAAKKLKKDPLSAGRDDE